MQNPDGKDLYTIMRHRKNNNEDRRRCCHHSAYVSKYTAKPWLEDEYNKYRECPDCAARPARQCVRLVDRNTVFILSPTPEEYAKQSLVWTHSETIWLLLARTWSVWQNGSAVVQEETGFSVSLVISGDSRRSMIREKTWKKKVDIAAVV